MRITQRKDSSVYRFSLRRPLISELRSLISGASLCSFSASLDRRRPTRLRRAYDLLDARLRSSQAVSRFSLVSYRLVRRVFRPTQFSRRRFFRSGPR